MKKAINKLKQLAEDNADLANRLEEKGIKLWEGAEQLSQERVDNLVKSCRYRSQCLYIAVWLLENDEKTK